jgi:hypothetical protein
MADSTITIKDANGVDKTISTVLNGGVHTFKHTIVSDDGSASFDPTSEALKMISFEHGEIHEGKFFILDLVDTNMANTNYIGISFTTPAAAAGRIHFIMAFASKAAAHLELIEIPQTLTNGTAATPLNRFRDSVNTSGLTSVKTYDSTAGDVITIGTGTIIHDLYAWSDRKIGDKNRDFNEFILKANTSYAVKLTADENTNAGHIILNWYEHIDS